MLAASDFRADGLSEISRRGLTLYEEQLRAILEPRDNGKVVAIDVDTGDYAVADTSPAAMRMMLQRNPEATLVMRTIGPERRHGVVARALGIATGVHNRG